MNDTVKKYISPEAEVLVAKLRKASQNAYNPNSTEKFEIKVLFEGAAPEVMETKKRLRSANDYYVITTSKNADGDIEVLPNGQFKTTFKAEKDFPPKVNIKDEATGEVKRVSGKDIPYVFANNGDVARAVIGYTIVDKVRKDGTPYQIMRLSEVTFTKLDLKPFEPKTVNYAEQEYASDDIAKMMREAGF